MANQISCYEIGAKPGTAFDYNDWQMELFFQTLTLKAWGRGLGRENFTLTEANTELLQRTLAEPIGCEDGPTWLYYGLKGAAAPALPLPLPLLLLPCPVSLLLVSCAALAPAPAALSLLPCPLSPRVFLRQSRPTKLGSDSGRVGGSARDLEPRLCAARPALPPQRQLGRAAADQPGARAAGHHRPPAALAAPCGKAPKHPLPKKPHQTQNPSRFP